MWKRFLTIGLSVALLVTGCAIQSDDVADPPTTTGSLETPVTLSAPPVVDPTVDPAPTDAPVTIPGPIEPIDLTVAQPPVWLVQDEAPYTGVLGQINQDRLVVTPVANPPSPDAPDIAPLTGLPAPNVDLGRPAIYAKIDNSSPARPHKSLSQADLVYVAMVEGGLTRLAAIYHSTTPFEIGPVRSGRTTDIALLASLNSPIFVWSGANPVATLLLRRLNIVDFGAVRRSEYTRDSTRRAPYNLMTEPPVLWQAAKDLGEGAPPPFHFEYRSEGDALPATATPATVAQVTYPLGTSSWTWDAAVSGWRRSQDGSAHVDADGTQVIAANVLVAEIGHIPAGGRDAAQSVIYEEVFLGSGPGWVFTEGQMIPVTWTKPSVQSVATWTTADGAAVALTRGKTWVELAPPGSVSYG